MIPHELAVGGLHESHRCVDLMGDIRTVGAIFCHPDDLIEAAASFFQTRNDVFSVVLHIYYPTIGYGYYMHILIDCKYILLFIFSTIIHPSELQFAHFIHYPQVI